MTATEAIIFNINNGTEINKFIKNLGYWKLVSTVI